MYIFFSSGEKFSVPADLSCGEDESVAQAVVSVDFSIVECLRETSNQELKSKKKHILRQRKSINVNARTTENYK